MTWDIQLQTIEAHPIQIYAGHGSKVRRSRLNRFCELPLTKVGLSLLVSIESRNTWIT